ncbi:MAG: quinolinate synthase NadA [Gemmatimonadota bacterium]
MAIEATTLDGMHAELHRRLHDVVPEAELRYKAELALEVNRVKKERGAVILGHNYMEPALYHSVCDYVGDSLELARIGATTNADPIVFCGVRFMAETAKIMNPDRTVLLPSAKGGCSLAESITAADVRRLKKRYPGVPVVTYVNTYADVKAETDVCCTSSNAARVVEALDSDAVIFLPDEFLAQNVARETGKRIIFPVLNSDNGKGGAPDNLQYELIGWRGRCEVHDQFTVQDVETVRAQFPDVFVLAHPECRPDVVEASDYSGSTSQMIREVKKSEKPRYLLLTECSMADNIAAEVPDREMVRLCSVRCPHMNEITLEDTLAALQKNQHRIELSADLMQRARRPIERMLEIG